MANIKNRKKLQLTQTIWDVTLYSQHFTFHWKLLILVNRIEKSGTEDNNFGKWKGTFRSHRPKWPDRSLWATFKAGPEYSGRTKPKWSVPFDEPTEISGLLGWMESAPSFCNNFAQNETLVTLAIYWVRCPICVVWNNDKQHEPDLGYETTNTSSGRVSKLEI